MTELIVTTVQHASKELIDTGKSVAEQLTVPFVARDKNSLAQLRSDFAVDNILVITKHGPVVDTPGGKFFFHLNMAELRIKNIINGKHDHMVAAMNLSAGMSVLDCTLGLATDAIVASYIVTDTGHVVGLESSPVISLIAQMGLKTFVTDCNDITAAMRRIRVENVPYEDYLAALPDNSFDVIFFDPMFRQPIHTSAGLKPLRSLADARPLTPEAIKQALRVAKKRVVIKETQGSDEFERLGITHKVGGKYSSIQYGILEAGG